MTLNLWKLHERHHVAASVLDALCGAARVCLDRHHSSPVAVGIGLDGDVQPHALAWEPASPIIARSHLNELDATRDGAYAVSFLAVECRLGLVAISRAEHATGCDWYAAPPGRGFDESGMPDLDDPSVVRLEVSGQDMGSVGRRVKQKVAQAAAGVSPVPAYTVVVGFHAPVVDIRKVKAS